MNNLISQIRISLVATVILAVILCGAYPALIWGIAQALFPDKANGSLIIRNGTGNWLRTDRSKLY